MTKNQVYFEYKDPYVTDLYLRRNPEYDMFFYDEGRILSAEMVQTIEFADTYGQDTYEESMLNLYFKDKEGNVTD